MKLVVVEGGGWRMVEGGGCFYTSFFLTGFLCVGCLLFFDIMESHNLKG